MNCTCPLSLSEKPRYLHGKCRLVTGKSQHGIVAVLLGSLLPRYPTLLETPRDGAGRHGGTAGRGQ